MKENPEEYTVIHESNPEDPLEYLSDIKRDYQDLEEIPAHL